MKTRTCSACGAVNTLQSTKCWNCGDKLSEQGSWKFWVLVVVVWIIWETLKN